MATAMLNQRTKSYSNLNVQLEIDLEEERQALLEDQRIIRQRAQKLSVETNRRRRALEERRREEELREQRFREEVLHQRKLKLQEATEKFQRAHLPPSQRRRPVYAVPKKPTPKLEDALSQIQAPLSSTFYYLSNHRSPSNTRTADTPSSVSSVGISTWPNRQQAPQRRPFERVFQEKPDSDQRYFQHKLEEAQRLLEEQHLSSLQNFHQEVEQLGRSESLSSLDSLEGSLNSTNEQEPQGDTLHQALSAISSSVKVGNLFSGKNNDFKASSHMFIPEKITAQNSPVKDKELSLSKSEHLMTNTELQNGSSSSTLRSSPERNPSPVSTAETRVGNTDMGYRENTNGTLVVKPGRAWATPDSASIEAVPSSRSHENKDGVQRPGLSVKPTVTQPMATPVVIPSTGNSAETRVGNPDMGYRENTTETLVVKPSRAWATPDSAQIEALPRSHENKDTVHRPGLLVKPTVTQPMSTPVVIPSTGNSAETRVGNPDMGYRENTTETLVVKQGRAWATPDSAQNEAMLNSRLQENKDTVQRPGLSVKPTMTQPMATPVVIPSTGNSAETRVGNDMGYRENTTGTLVVKQGRAWATPDSAPSEAVPSSRSHDNKDTVQRPGLLVKPTMATPVVIPSTGNSGITSADKASKFVHEAYSKSFTYQDDGTAMTYNPQVYKVKSDHSKHMENRGGENFPRKSDENFLHKSDDNLPHKTGENLLHNSGQNSSHRNLFPPNLASRTYSEPRIPPNEYGPSQDHPDAAVPTFQVKMKSSSPANKLLKSILKKGSKYEKGYGRTLGIGRMLQLGEKSPPVIRDSVELTKEKENKKNKKLRWLDEMDKPNKDVPSTSKRPPLESPPTTNFMDHVVVPNISINDQLGPSAGMPSSGHSTGYHFTKQAWMATKGEEMSSVGYSHAARTPPKAKTRVVKRPKSAKAQSAVAYRHRRGVIIRPQSASEASKLAKTQTKAMVPHPPPRPASANPNAEMVPDAKSTHNAQGNPSNGAAPSSNYILTRDTMPPQTLSRSSANLMASQGLSANESSAKKALTLNSERVLALQETLPSSAKRPPVYGENGLRLDHTPTDEEIALLWQGVRSALYHKTSSSGDLRPGDLPPNTQQPRPNMSHLIIDGGTLSHWKSVPRLNGFSSPFVNGYVTLPRRRQILGSSENNKRKALMDQRKGRPNSAGWRPPLSQIFHTAKLGPFPSSQEPAPAYSVPGSGEVSDSMAQFMLAENLAETSATDAEILAAIQANKQNPQNYKSQNSGHTALSIEEQRLLQSLDRLNQRLQNVQDTIKPLGAMNGFPAKSTLSIHHIPPQQAESAASSHKYSSLSADPRTRLQRRY